MSPRKWREAPESSPGPFPMTRRCHYGRPANDSGIGAATVQKMGRHLAEQMSFCQGTGSVTLVCRKQVLVLIVICCGCANTSRLRNSMGNAIFRLKSVAVSSIGNCPWQRTSRLAINRYNGKNFHRFRGQSVPRGPPEWWHERLGGGGGRRPLPKSKKENIQNGCFSRQLVLGIGYWSLDKYYIPQLLPH